MQFQLATLVLLASSAIATPIALVTSSTSSVAAPASTASTTVLHGSMLDKPEYKVRKSTTVLHGSMVDVPTYKVRKATETASALL